MKQIFVFILAALFYSNSFAQYPEWEAMKDNYTINLFDDISTETGIVSVTSDFATVNSSVSPKYSALFDAAIKNKITVSCAANVENTDYFSIDFHEFLYKQSSFSSWEIDGTLIDLSSGGLTIELIAKANQAVQIEVQLIDANGHVTSNTTHIVDTIDSINTLDTLTFSGFVLEDWDSETWWGVDNQRGEKTYFPQAAVIPVDASKIVSLRFKVQPLEATTTPIGVTFENVSLRSLKPIIQLPPQPYIVPHYETTDTLRISDFFFDSNTDINDIVWSFVPSDPNVIVEYDDVKKIIVISNLSKPTTIDITGENGAGFSTTQKYSVFYVTSLDNIITKVTYNPHTKLITWDSGKAEVSIYNAIGALENKTNAYNQYNISFLEKGMYIISVKTSKGNTSFKILR